MDFNQRQAKFSKKRSQKANQGFGEPILFGIDDVLMNLFCSYVLSSNSNVHKFSISNLDKLMRSISPSTFENNPLLALKHRFLLRALEDRVSGLSGELILSDVSRHMDTTALLQDQRFVRELSNEEVRYVEETVAQFLNTMVFDSRLNTLMQLCKDYEHADYRERQSILSNVRSVMTDTMTQFRRNDVASHSPSTRFRLSSMNDSMEEIHNYLSNPSYKLVTGMQGFNALLGGGFQKTKLYCMFGMSGEGKTVTLVNLLYQIWKYNRGFRCKDPTKKPCIVLLTMENLVIEYICSLFHVITRGGNIRDCSSAQACLEEFKSRKFEYRDVGDIEIVIDYKPVNTVDTRYMYQLVEELEDEGFETICFIMDYLMRIRPSEYTHDLYTDLGTIANDFKTFAILKDIPFITASQLNREAAKIIDEGRNANQRDIIKKLGRATIGDSVQIDRNIDGTIILVPEVSASGERYMAYKLTKHRYEVFTNKVSIFQPMYEGSYIALVEDLFDPKPAFRESLARDVEEIREAFGDVERVTINNTIRSLGELTSTKEMLMPRLVEDNPPAEIGIATDKLVERKLTPIVGVVPKELRRQYDSTYQDQFQVT